MKKNIIALIITILFLSSPAHALHRQTDFIGGCAYCLDVIDGARLTAKTKPVYAIVSTTPEHATYPSKDFTYLWDSDAGCAESVPGSIIPDLNAAGGCWILLTPGQAADIVADSVKDTHIDWGTGADQVSAVDIPIADGGGIITGTEVETALQENRTAVNLNTADSHAESHTVASHSDTTATGTELETLTDTSDASALHNHTTANLNDTTATGANLNTLTDDSMGDALHRHSELSASDGTPDQAVAVAADGTVTIHNDLIIDDDGVGIGTTNTVDIVDNGDDGGDRPVVDVQIPMRVTQEINQAGFGGLGALEVFSLHPNTTDLAGTFSNAFWSGMTLEAISGTWTTATNAYIQLSFHNASGTETFTGNVTNVPVITNFASAGDYVVPLIRGVSHVWSEISGGYTGIDDGVYTVTDMYGLSLDGLFTGNKTINVSGLWSEIFIGDSAGGSAPPTGTVATRSGIWIEPQTIGDTNNYAIAIDGNVTGANYGSAVAFGDAQQSYIYYNSAAELVMDNVTQLKVGSYGARVGPPATENINAGDTITADACGSFKAINTDDAANIDTGAVPLTACGATLSGCQMTLKNTDSADTITLLSQASTDFSTIGDINLVLPPGGMVDLVCSSGTWNQKSAVVTLTE